MAMKRKDNKGFTLVELIVVLVILAVMAAIIIPIAHSHIDEAKKQQEIQDAQAYMKAIQTELTNSYKDIIVELYPELKNMIYINIILEVKNLL